MTSPSPPSTSDQATPLPIAASAVPVTKPAPTLATPPPSASSSTTGPGQPPADKPARRPHQPTKPKRSIWFYIIGYATSAVVGIGGGLIGLHFLNKDRDLYQPLASIPIAEQPVFTPADLPSLMGNRVTVQDVLYLKANGESVYRAHCQTGDAVLLSSTAQTQGAILPTKSLGTIYITTAKPIRYIKADALRGRDMPEGIVCVPLLLHIPTTVITSLQQRATAAQQPVVDPIARLIQENAAHERNRQERERVAKLAEQQEQRRQAEQAAQELAEQRERERLRNDAEQRRITEAQREKLNQEMSLSMAESLANRAALLEQAVLKNGEPYTKMNIPKEFHESFDALADDIDSVTAYVTDMPAYAKVVTGHASYPRYVAARDVFLGLCTESKAKWSKYQDWVSRQNNPAERERAQREQADLRARIEASRAALRAQMDDQAARATPRRATDASGVTADDATIRRRYSPSRHRWERYSPSMNAWFAD